MKLFVLVLDEENHLDDILALFEELGVAFTIPVNSVYGLAHES